jgi:hypothetical protein
MDLADEDRKSSCKTVFEHGFEKLILVYFLDYSIDQKYIFDGKIILY